MSTCRLPNELLAEIIKHAIQPQWPDRLFFPPPTDAACVKGFRAASSTCRNIVRALEHESLRVSDMATFSAMHIPFPTSVRHLYIGDPPSFLDFQNFPINKLPSFTQLTSLSFPQTALEIMQGGTPPIIFPFLLRFEIRLPSDVIGYTAALGTDYIHASTFPNLTELHIGVITSLTTDITSRPSTVSIIGSSFSRDAYANCLVCGVLTQLVHLKRLSIDVSLDHVDRFTEMKQIHHGSIQHLQSSEGYERHYSDCPLCIESYDHSVRSENENTIVQILAQAFPALGYVTWLDLWCQDWRDGRGRREIQIVRANGQVALHRTNDASTS